MPKRETRIAAAVAAGAGVVVVVGWMVIPSRGQEPLSADDVHILARLDEFTRAADPGTTNTVPAFLALPGTLGVIDGGGDSAGAGFSRAAAVDVLGPAELLKGFCTSNLPALVRQQYPDSYHELSDAELETLVVAKHPEYRDRVCVLPAWIPQPHDIVKYEPRPSAGFWPFRK